MHSRASTKKSKEYRSDILYVVSIKEDTSYLCLHFTRNHEELKSDTPYPEDSICRIEDYLKILKDIKRGPYSKKPPIRRIDLNQYGEMDNPDITMEEYVQLEIERALRNAIVYNDAWASKSGFSSELTVSPQHVDEVNLKDKTSLSEYNDEEYNVISFNDLFPFNIYSFNDSKSHMDNDNDDKIDVKQFSRDLSIKPLPNVININVGSYA
ncbi:hypothetical protein Tco_0566562 [Tanacetum coccineum]